MGRVGASSRSLSDTLAVDGEKKLMGLLDRRWEPPWRGLWPSNAISGAYSSNKVL